MLSPASFAKLSFITSPFCECCGFPFAFDTEGHQGKKCGSCLKSLPPYSSARAALIYDDVSRDLILKFKHGDQLDMVHSFVPWLLRVGAAQIERADYIVPVPLHRRRLIKRRYNQAAIIAQALARSTQKTFLGHVISRHRATPTQGNLNYKERKKNVRAAFQINEKHRQKIKGKTVLLIDDVYTTGATVKECTKILLSAGAASVHVLSVARVVRPNHDY
jgi:ComF family protein